MMLLLRREVYQKSICTTIVLQSHACLMLFDVLVSVTSGRVSCHWSGGKSVYRYWRLYPKGALCQVRARLTQPLTVRTDDTLN